MVWDDWQPVQLIWRWFSLHPDPNPNLKSATVANIMYRHGFGWLRSSRSGFWTDLELNRLVFLDPTRTASRLPESVANTWYDPNVLIDSIYIKLQNGLLYYCQRFHYPTSVDHLGLACTVEYNNANQGVMSQSDNISVQYADSDLDNTFNGDVPYFRVLYFSWTPPNQILRFQDDLPATKMISTCSKWFKKIQQWILSPQAQEYAVVIPRKYKDPYGCADCVHRFIQVVKLTDKIHIEPVGAIVGPAHLVQENAASDRMDGVRLVNSHENLDTYWTVYSVTTPESRCAGGR